MTISSQEQFQQPIVGHRYRMRRGTKAERIRINESWPAYPCGFCGAEAPPRDLKWRRLLVEIVPIRKPQTSCCRAFEEPPPGSFSAQVISGSQVLNGTQVWCVPLYAGLLAPVEV